MSDSAAAQPNTSFFGRFTVLRGAMLELWVTFAVKFLAVAAYQVMNFTIVLWLSADLGYNDERAGAIVAGWSILMTVFTILVAKERPRLNDAIAFMLIFAAVAVSMSGRSKPHLEAPPNADAPDPGPPPR